MTLSSVITPGLVGAALAGAALLGLVAFALAVDYATWKARDLARRRKAFAEGATDIEARPYRPARGIVGRSPYREGKRPSRPFWGSQ